MNKILIFSMMIAILVSCNYAEDAKVESKPGSSIKEEPVLLNFNEIKVDSEFRKNFNAQTVVEGTIHNTSGAKYSKVKLKVKFLNKNGKLMKSDIITLENLSPGDTPYKNKFSYWDAGFAKVIAEVVNAEKNQLN